MSCYFSENEVIRFKDGTAYIIKEMIGKGASCVVYRALHINDQIKTSLPECLLKEYHPSYIPLTRNEKGELTVKFATDQKRYEDGRARFLAGCELQGKFRNDPDLTNVTSNIHCFHEGYGTVFVEMTRFSGKSYEKIQEKSLSDLLCRMKMLTKTVAQYHNKGYLHLDLKPENIFALPETSEMILLFDFDSVVAKTELGNENVRLSYTPKWAAPELLGSNPFSEVNESTDLYSIGMIFFHKLTGTFPDQTQLSGRNHHFDPNSRLLKKSNKHVLSLLSNFFRNTLCEVKECRWQTAEEVISALDDLLDAVNRPQRSYNPVLIAAIVLCIPLVPLAFLYLFPGTGARPSDVPITDRQEILSSETKDNTDEGTQTETIEPGVSHPDGPTGVTENISGATETTENTTDPPTENTEESVPPSSTDDDSDTTYSINTIAYTSDNFRSMIVTNDGVVYYIDGTVISSNASSERIDMQADFDAPLENGYLAYDPYNDVVYLLAGGPLTIYDISDLSKPVLVMENMGIDLDYNSMVTPQIAVLRDGSLLVPADLDGTYRVNISGNCVTPFAHIYNLNSPYYAMLVEDRVLTFREDSKGVAVMLLTGGQEYDIQLEENAPYANRMCVAGNNLLLYSDGIGVCQFGIDGAFSVLIAQEDIKINDFQSLDYTNIWSIAANENGTIAFYDNTLKCIRCISSE